MKNSKFIKELLPIFFSIFFVSLYAQTDEHKEPSTNNEHTEKTEHKEEHHSEFKKHSFSVVVSHTHINSAKENPDGKNLIAAPSLCLNYNYNFNHKWAIGLHNDIIIETIDLEHTNEGGDGITRERPISMAIMGSYKPTEHLAILLGAGREFSNHEDFTVIRFGIETPFHIQNNWEIFATLTADVGIGNYDSLTFGFGIAKLF